MILATANCSKDSEKIENESNTDMYNKELIENATFEEKVAYAEFHLLKIATYIAKDMKSNKIADVIFEKGQINGANGTITAQELINVVSLNSRNSNQDKEMIEINKSLTAFENLEGVNWTAAISTVMFEKKQNRRGFDDSEPIFVLSTDTEKENQLVDGYQLNSSNIMEKIGIPVTETVAKNNEVFKVAIIKNEINGDENGGGGSSGGGGGSGSGNLNDTNPIPTGTVIGSGGTSTLAPYVQGLKINKMTCINKKESWIETNDVHFIGAKDNVDPLIDVIDVPQYFPKVTNGWVWNIGTPLTSQTNVEGSLIRHFTSSECDNQTQILINWLIDFGNNQSQGQVLYGIIFEHDNWPAPKKEVVFTFPNNQIKILQYRSYENEYARPMLYNQNCFTNCNNPTSFPSTNDYWINSDGWMIYNLFRG